MKLKSLIGLVLSLAVFTMFGCGGGGTGGGTPAPITSTVTGTAAKGPILGGTVTIFAILNGAQASTPLATIPAAVTTSTTDGTYTATVSYTGPALVVITGGSYIDEATGQTVNLAGQPPLRAALANVTGTVTANVTPFTEIAVKEALGLTGGLTVANINEANTSVSTLIGAPNILSTSTADQNYALALATVSQAQLDTGTGLDALLISIANGLDLTTDTITDPAVDAVINTASDNVLINPNVNPDIKPTALTLAASPTTGVINNQGPVTITATVTYDNGVPVINGTVVNFTVTSGTGTLSAASAATSGGTASVVLNSTVAGSVVVSAATSTSAAATVTVPFIAQPTTATVKVATSGTLPAGTLIGGVSATVTYPPAGLSILASNVVVSGVATGSLLAANTNTAGQVILGLISATGIQAGEFATLTFSVAAGTFPVAADFAIAAGASVIDTNGQPIPGINVVIQSVAVQ